MSNVAEIFWRFLMLGCVSFGGPAAHIGYFYKEFVEKRQWLDEAAYARLIALSQFLPGPASSQVGFALGVRRGGVAGGAAAFLGFTLPSFALMYTLAGVAPADDSGGPFAAVVHGLKLLAVVVVADAVLSLYRKFCTDTISAAIAVLTAAGLLLSPGTAFQVVLLALAAVFGAAYRGRSTPGGTADDTAGPAGIRYLPFIAFITLFLLAPLSASLAPALDLFSRFYQAGSLVFGGGHVVLPLLQESVGGLVTTDQFLLGYAAAQAVPGPMFTMSTYLGAEIFVEQPLMGATIATAAVFLPGFLLVLALQGAWESLAARPRIAGAVWGINAAVVGLILATLYRPVFTSAVLAPLDFALVLLGFFLLRAVQVPILWLVLGFAAAGWGIHLLT